MALPARIERGHAPDPFQFARDFNSMLGRFFGGGLLGEAGESGTLQTMGAYGVDIREDADHVYVEADMPGFRKEDIDIALQDNTLTIMAEKREEISAQPQSGPPAQQGQPSQQQQQAQQQQAQARPQGDYLLRERRMERFVRSFTLPVEVDEKNVQAKLENGVLKITLNKGEEAKAKHIRPA